MNYLFYVKVRWEDQTCQQQVLCKIPDQQKKREYGAKEKLWPEPHVSSFIKEFVDFSWQM